MDEDEDTRAERRGKINRIEIEQVANGWLIEVQNTGYGATERFVALSPGDAVTAVAEVLGVKL